MSRKVETFIKKGEFFLSGAMAPPPWPANRRAGRLLLTGKLIRE